MVPEQNENVNDSNTQIERNLRLKVMTDFEETVKKFFERKEKGWRKTDIPLKKKLFFDKTLRSQLENELKVEFLKFAKGYSE